MTLGAASVSQSAGTILLALVILTVGGAAALGLIWLMGAAVLSIGDVLPHLVVGGLVGLVVAAISGSLVAAVVVGLVAAVGVGVFNRLG